MSDAKRNEISEKISAAARRNVARAEPPADRAGEKAIETKDKLAAFARKHPVALVTGGLAAGILISALFRGSPTRKAGRAIGKKTAGLAGIATDLAIAYATQAFGAADDARKAGADKLQNWGQSLGEDARDYARSAADAARSARKSVSETIRSRIH